MHSFYEQQHPDHTERRRQALRDAATKDRTIRRLRHGDADGASPMFSAVERRRLLGEMADDRNRANEVHIDPLGWRDDVLAPHRPGASVWPAFMLSSTAWALTLVLVIAIVVVAGIRP